MNRSKEVATRAKDDLLDRMVDAAVKQSVTYPVVPPGYGYTEKVESIHPFTMRCCLRAALEIYDAKRDAELAEAPEPATPDPDIDQAALDAMLKIVKLFDAKFTHATVQRNARVQVVIIEAMRKLLASQPAAPVVVTDEALIRTTVRRALSDTARIHEMTFSGRVKFRDDLADEATATIVRALLARQSASGATSDGMEGEPS